MMKGKSIYRLIDTITISRICQCSLEYLAPIHVKLATRNDTTSLP